MPIPSNLGEGRCSGGRNEKGHSREHRGIEPDIFVKTDGITLGRTHCQQGLVATCGDCLHKASKAEADRDSRFGA